MFKPCLLQQEYPRQLSLILGNLPSDKETNQGAQIETVLRAQDMEAEWIGSNIGTEVFKGFKWKEGMKADLKNNEVAI